MRRALVGGALVAGAWWALRRPEVQHVDVRVGDAVRWSDHPVLERVVIGSTDLGSVYAVCGVAATLAATGRRRTAADVLATGLLAWFGAQRSKTYVLRERPYEAHGVRRLIRPPTGSSFPSGHATVAMAMMSLLADRSRLRRGRVLAYAVGAWVGLTRVYVGVHYPTDIVGGAGLGLALSAVWRGRVARAGRVLTEPAAVALARILPLEARLAMVALLAQRAARAFRGGVPAEEFAVPEAAEPGPAA